MSVQKSFRLSELNAAILEILAERAGKKQTEIIEALIHGHVVWDMPAEDMSEILQEAEKRVGSIKARGEEKEA